MQLRINATNVKIIVFIELNNKDAYCAHENAKNVRNVKNIDAFMNMSQLKVTQIWDIRLNEYLKYWSLKALKSVTVTFYKLQMQTLKIFMKNKQLTWWQVNYLNILLKFNFQIIFQSNKINIKVDALTKMLMINSSESVKDINDHFQTILILNWIDVLLIKFKIEFEYEINLYQCVHLVNQKNELCNEYQQAMNKDKLKLHDMKLKNCQIIDNVLFKKSLLWVLKQMHTKLLWKIHD